MRHNREGMMTIRDADDAPFWRTLAVEGAAFWTFVALLTTWWLVAS